MSLHEWVEMRSQKLQTKEKRNGAEKGGTMGTAGSQDTTEPMGDRQETAGGSTEEGKTETGEMVEAEVPLVQKRRKLMKAG